MLELLWQLRNKQLWGAVHTLHAVFGPDCFQALYIVAWALQVGLPPVPWPGGSKHLHCLAAPERQRTCLLAIALRADQTCGVQVPGAQLPDTGGARGRPVLALCLRALL